MSALMPVECPTCGSGRVVKHCPDSNPVCDLVRCNECKSFGNTEALVVVGECQVTQPTALERKHAAKQALAILTASNADEHVLVSEIITNQGDMLPVVAASMAGFASGLLKSFDDQFAGAADCWLAFIGQSVEAMSESEEA